MKRVFVMVGVVLAMAPTLGFAAKWMPIGTSGGDAFFLDTDSIQTSGDSVTFWYKRNYGERDRHGDLSSKIQVSINCARRDTITRYGLFYDDTNNKGKVTSQEQSKGGQWSPIPPDSVIDEMRKWVCPSR